MQAFTLKHFATGHPGEPFPSFTSITSEEIDRIRERLSRSIHVDVRTPWRELYKELLTQAERVEAVDAEDEDRFDLIAVLRALGIAPKDLVYLA